MNLFTVPRRILRGRALPTPPPPPPPPIATILSAAMMLSLSFGLQAEAKAVEDAVETVLASGARTRDIAAGGPYIGCVEMTDQVIAAL